MTKVFISYSREDFGFAEFVAAKLRERGAEVFIDYASLLAGENWISRIGKEIKQRDYVVLILSPRSVISNWVQDEIAYARHHYKTIVPLLLESVSEDDMDNFFFLVNKERIDFTMWGKGSEPKISVQKLAEALGLPKYPLSSEGSDLDPFRTMAIKRHSSEDDLLSLQEADTVPMAPIPLPSRYLLSDSLELVVFEECVKTNWQSDRESYVIGRGAECDLILPYKAVSRHHIRILHQSNNGYILEDLSSLNGTWLNGRRLKPGEVKHLCGNDQINVGLAVEIHVMHSGHKPSSTNFERMLLYIQNDHVYIRDQEISLILSRYQFVLLNVLYDFAGVTLARDELAERMSDRLGKEVSPSQIQKHIGNLRERLRRASDKEIIITERGKGYYLNCFLDEEMN